MHILILTSKFPRFKNDPQPGFVYYLAKEYIKLGIKVSVIAPHSYGSKLRENFEGIKVYRFKYFLPTKLQKFAYGAGIPANVGGGFLAKFQAIPYTLSQIISTLIIVKKLKPDFIHAHWAFPQGLSAYLTGLPYITTIYGGEVFLSKKFKLVRIMNYLIDKSKKSFSITQGLLEVMKEFGFKSKNLEVIPLGFDSNRFYPKVKSYQELKKKLNPNGPIILNVGRLVEKKGQIYLIKAFKEVVKEFKNAKLVIIGDGPLKDKLKKEVKQLGLEKQVIFLGEIGHEELPKYYCASDVFVLPSIIDKISDRETQGVVLLEAMACKCPVIGTDTGGIPDVISKKEVGILVQQKNSRQLVYQIVYLLKNKKIKNNLAESAFHYVINNFKWNKIAQKYFDYIKNLIDHEKSCLS